MYGLPGRTAKSILSRHFGPSRDIFWSRRAPRVFFTFIVDSKLSVKGVKIHAWSKSSGYHSKSER